MIGLIELVGAVVLLLLGVPFNAVLVLILALDALWLIVGWIKPGLRPAYVRAVTRLEWIIAVSIGAVAASVVGLVSQNPVSAFIAIVGTTLILASMIGRPPQETRESQ